MTNPNIVTPNLDRPKIEYEIVGIQSNDDESGQYKIKFTNTEFDDIIVSIYGVSFEEHEDEAIMKFDYDILEGEVANENAEKFKQLLGDFILQCMEEQIKTNSLVYKGGVDED